MWYVVYKQRLVTNAPCISSNLQMYNDVSKRHLNILDSRVLHHSILKVYGERESGCCWFMHCTPLVRLTFSWNTTFITGYQ